MTPRHVTCSLKVALTTKEKGRKKGECVKLQMVSIRTLKAVICMRHTNPLPWVQILVFRKHHRSVVAKHLSTNRESVCGSAT